MENCSLSTVSNLCHQKKYTCSVDIRRIKTVELTLLKLRTNFEGLTVQSTICSHHEKVFLTVYSSEQRKCADPFSKHKKPISKGLNIITLSYFDKFRSKELPIEIVPGKKWCISCLKEANRLLDQFGEANDDVSDSVTSKDVTEQPIQHSDEDDIGTEAANSPLVNLEITPVKKKELTQSKKRKKGKEKLLKARKGLRSSLESSFQVTLSETESEDEIRISSEERNDSDDWKSIMNELKEKYKNSKNFAEKVQILTLSPYSIRKTMDEFGASQWMVKKSREIKREKGVLGIPDKKHGRPLKEEIKADVVAFYECDENSRMCPSQKDCDSAVNEEGQKLKVQKRIMLSNLKELFAAWEKQNVDKKISFSTFAGLRPKHCILAGAAGTHLSQT